jgi:hypothetical protein
VEHCRSILIGEWVTLDKKKTVLWQSSNGKWTLSENERGNGLTPYIMLDDQWISIYPILYDNSDMVGYDAPELVPQYVKDAVRKTLVDRRDKNECENSCN